MHHGPIYMDPTFWVGVGLVLFLLVIIWKKVPGVLAKQLDNRSAAIAAELDEARRLREEAQALLATYQSKAKDAEREAEDILAAARTEADRLQSESRVALEGLIARRTKMAEDKIRLAEASALTEVKTAAANAAVTAAGQILSSRIDGAKASEIASTSIRELRSKLN